MSREIEDAYRAPAADSDEPGPYGHQTDDGADLYVIALPKLIVLYTATLGAYGLYWFYKQFNARKRYDEPHSRPLARAFTSVFYVHRLFRFIDAQARDQGLEPSWTPNAMATLYVVSVVGARLFGRVVSFGAASTAFLLSTVLGLGGVMFAITSAQRVANQASGDPDGKANAGADAGSALACVLGVGLWAFSLKMLLITQTLESLQPDYEP